MVTYHPSHGPVVLCIMDGWGHRAEPEHNAVALAKTPVFDALMANQPHSFLAASGADVGLPDGQVGNSEPILSRLRHSCGHRAARRMSWGFYHQAACMRIKTIFWLS